MQSVVVPELCMAPLMGKGMTLIFSALTAIEMWILNCSELLLQAERVSCSDFIMLVSPVVCYVYAGH